MRNKSSRLWKCVILSSQSTLVVRCFLYRCHHNAHIIPIWHGISFFLWRIYRFAAWTMKSIEWCLNSTEEYNGQIIDSKCAPSNKNENQPSNSLWIIIIIIIDASLPTLPIFFLLFLSFGEKVHNTIPPICTVHAAIHSWCISINTKSHSYGAHNNSNHTRCNHDTEIWVCIFMCKQNHPFASKCWAERTQPSTNCLRWQ